MNTYTLADIAAMRERRICTTSHYKMMCGCCGNTINRGDEITQVLGSKGRMRARFASFRCHAADAEAGCHTPYAYAPTRNEWVHLTVVLSISETGATDQWVISRFQPHTHTHRYAQATQRHLTLTGGKTCLTFLVPHGNGKANVWRRRLFRSRGAGGTGERELPKKLDKIGRKTAWKL